MPQGPNDSPLKITPEMEKALAEAIHPSDITRIMHDGLKNQGFVDADPFDPSVLHVREEAAHAAAPATRFGAKVTIDGKVHVAEGATQAEADAKIVEVIRAATHPTTRDDQGRFSATQGRTDEATAKAIEQELLRKSELELKFKRGEIDTATYLAESGAIEQHLASQGIDMDVLRKATVTPSWEKATTAFLNSPAGSDWPGGEANKLKMAQLIEENGLADAPDKTAAMAAVYGYMKANHLIVPNEEIARQTAESERDKAIREARTPEELKAAVRIGQSSGGTFFRG